MIKIANYLQRKFDTASALLSNEANYFKDQIQLIIRLHKHFLKKYITHFCRRAFFRRNSRHLRRLSRLYDWEVDDNGQLKPIVDEKRIQRAASKNTEHCSNDSYILETILHKYNPHKIPGGQVSVEVEGIQLAEAIKNCVFENIALIYSYFDKFVDYEQFFKSR